ncbi:hypothetical protein BBP40_005062 [Aspergillus hancockii]|nr:hypothetical protein BBP40_005062 [Aspergillus hancockii]
MELEDSHLRKRRCVKERIRVTRACDTCKRKKLRCTGTIPCSLCQRSSLNCEYTAEYTRGRVPPIPPLHQPPKESNVVAQRIGQSPSPHRDPYPPSPEVQTTVNHLLPQVDQDASNPPSRVSPEPHQIDMEGHYVGPSSGVSFLIRVQKRLNENIAFPLNNPIFSFGDAPLPKSEASLLVLPSKSEASALVRRYFDFAFPTHRFLHQQQVENWLENLYDRLDEPHAPEPGEREIRALLLMVFAQATQYQSESGRGSTAPVKSAVFFAASEHHLAAETGRVRLTSVQARLAQCFYLLSESRINHCWSLFGTTARLAIAIGLHRRRRREHTGMLSVIEQECGKRVFWCAYSLDNYLSAALGRSRVFHDGDIDQELPEIAEDSQITSSAILPSTTHSQSLMLAPVYHAKLSKIISGILQDLYGIQRSALGSQVSAAHRYATRLAQWRKELSGFLDLPSVNLLMLTYQRQYTVLNLAFYHAHILLYRPFVLKSFMSLTKEITRRNGQLHNAINQNIEACLDAATKIVAIVHELCEGRKMYRAFWFTHYYAFSAVVVLYVHFIRNCSHKSSPEANITYYTAGKQGQEDLASCGSQSSFAQRYVMVLEELRKEADKAKTQAQHATNDGGSVNGSYLTSTEREVSGYQRRSHRSDRSKGQHPSNSLGASQTIPYALEQGIPSEPFPSGTFRQQPEPQEFVAGPLDDVSPSSYIADLASWGEFDSLATTGLADFGSFFPFEGLQGFGN